MQRQERGWLGRLPALVLTALDGYWLGCALGFRDGVAIERSNQPIDCQHEGCAANSHHSAAAPENRDHRDLSGPGWLPTSSPLSHQARRNHRISPENAFVNILQDKLFQCRVRTSLFAHVHTHSDDARTSYMYMCRHARKYAPVF